MFFSVRADTTYDYRKTNEKTDDFLRLELFLIMFTENTIHQMLLASLTTPANHNLLS